MTYIGVGKGAIGRKITFEFNESFTGGTSKQIVTYNSIVPYLLGKDDVHLAGAALEALASLLLLMRRQFERAPHVFTVRLGAFTSLTSAGADQFTPKLCRGRQAPPATGH